MTLKLLVAKILCENSALQKESRAIINHCFHILISLSQNTEVVQTFFIQFDEVIFTLLHVLESNKIDFDEDIIEFVIALADNSKKLTTHYPRLFNCLPFIQANNGNKLTQIFPLINRFLAYQPNWFVPQNITSTLQMIQHSIENNDPKIRTWQQFDADSLCLLQVLIMNACKHLNKDHLDSILKILSVYINLQSLAFQRD